MPEQKLTIHQRRLIESLKTQRIFLDEANEALKNSLAISFERIQKYKKQKATALKEINRTKDELSKEGIEI